MAGGVFWQRFESHQRPENILKAQYCFRKLLAIVQNFVMDINFLNMMCIIYIGPFLAFVDVCSFMKEF